MEGGESGTASTARPFEEEEGDGAESLGSEADLQEGLEARIGIETEDGQEGEAGEGGTQCAEADQAAAATACGSGSATAEVVSRPLTTLPWLRDPDLMYASYIGVAAKEAAAAKAAATAQRPVAALEQLAAPLFSSFPELPEEEAKNVIARLGERSNREPPEGFSDGSKWKRRRTSLLAAEPGTEIETGEEAAAVASAGLGLEVDDDDRDLGTHLMSRVGGSKRLAEGPQRPGKKRRAESEPDPGLRAAALGVPESAGGEPVSGTAVGRGGAGSVGEGYGAFEDYLSGRGEAQRATVEAQAQRGEGISAVQTRTAAGGSAAIDDGKRGRKRKGSPDAARRRPFGRRYTGVTCDPVDAADSGGHALVITGPIIWCTVCGSHAARRLGKALKAACPGGASPANATRRARLRAGLHPLSGKPIV